MYVIISTNRTRRYYVKPNEKIILYAMSYLTVFNYVILLSILAYTQTNFTDYTGLALRFSIGALISIVSSIIIIRNHVEQKQILKITMIKLAIAHLPTIIGVGLSLLYLLN